MNNPSSVIIDADIARSSGKSEHPVSSGSRALLDTVSKNGHKAAMCPTLTAEWKRHRSLYAMKWFASMVAKKKIDFISPEKITEDLITKHLSEDNEVAIASKDAHLVDAALHTSKVIASNDDTARGVFCGLSDNCGSLRSIKWFNAVADRDFVASYLTTNCFVPNQYFIRREAEAD